MLSLAVFQDQPRAWVVRVDGEGGPRVSPEPAEVVLPQGLLAQNLVAQIDNVVLVLGPLPHCGLRRCLRPERLRSPFAPTLPCRADLLRREVPSGPLLARRPGAGLPEPGPKGLALDSEFIR